jgi:formylglycine-generating enzyme required for sulfatase activity
MQVDGENYLIPVNNSEIQSEEDVKDDCLSLSFIQDSFKGTSAKAFVVILDACRDNPFGTAKSAGAKGLAVVSKATASSTLIAFAASPGETASAGPSESNSIYTDELCKHLVATGLSLQDVFTKTRAGVRNRTSGKQRPREDNGLDESIILVEAREPIVVPKDDKSGTSTPSRNGQIPSAQLRRKYPLLSNYIEAMKVIPSGSFEMGHKKFDDTAPVHKVKIDEFTLGATPVTVGMWLEYVEATNKSMPPDSKSQEGTINFNVGWKQLDHPMVGLTYEWVLEYCAWVSELTGDKYTLPKESQWEYACRGGRDKQEFPWGDTFRLDLLWCSTKEFGDASGTASVNRSERIYRDHPYGLIDMLGNCSEWCIDWYDPDFYRTSQAKQDNAVNLSSSPKVKYKISEDTTVERPSRVCRGGSWFNTFLWTAFRQYWVEDLQLYSNGLRLCKK